MNINTSHKWLNIPDHELAIYNGIDTLATARAIKPMLQELTDQGMKDFWDEEIWPLVPAVLAMQDRGLLLDREALNSYRAEVRSSLASVDEEILKEDPTGKLRTPTTKAPNGLGAYKRVGNFLFNELGLKSRKLTDSGGYSVSQAALVAIHQNLRKKDAHAKPIVENLLHRSRLKTIYQRYLHIETDAQGIVRPVVKMGGAKSGRFAYDRPPLQQYPAEVRRIFIPRPGHIFVGFDYMQIEARIGTYLAGVTLDQGIFDAGKDLHNETCKETFEFTDLQWKDLDANQRKAARDYAKSFRYRLAYGGDPDQVGALASKTFCPCPRCTDLMPPTLNLPTPKIIAASQKFLGARPEILSWRVDLLKYIREHHYLINPLGRKKFMFGPIYVLRREAYNWPIQSTAADIINRAMRKGYTRYQLPYILQMHDCLILEVPEDNWERPAAQLKDVMQEPIAELGGMVIPVEMKIEKPWGVTYAP